MNGFWLVSYIVLWLVTIGEGLVLLALAREVEVLHKHVDSILPYLSKTHIDSQPPAE